MFRRLRSSAHEKVRNALRGVLAEHQTADREALRGGLDLIAARLSGDVAGVREHLSTELTRSTDRLRQEIIDLEWRQRRDLFFAADIKAAEQTHDFMQDRMPFLTPFPHPHDTLRYATRQVTVQGMVLEFGVATGTTLRLIAEGLPDHSIYGFDTFEGLPQNWRTGFPKGEFRQESIPEVPGVELVVGLFEDTLDGFLAQHPGPVALLHVDSDYYSAAMTVLNQVGPRLVPGSIIVFDEYFNYPGWQGGEHRAWEEFVESTGVGLEYLAYTFNHEQLVIRITEPPQA